MYTGAVLVKPDMSHMEVYPNFYIKDKTYVSCSPGLEDLEEKILTILSNWQDYSNMRRQGKEILMQSWNFDEHRTILERDIAHILTGGK